MAGKIKVTSEVTASDGLLWRAKCSRRCGKFPCDVVVRPVRAQDIEAIAELAAEAFRSISEQGGVEYFRLKIENILVGYYGRFLEMASFLALDGRSGWLAGAILATDDAAYGDPLVALVATHPTRWCEGIGRGLLYRCTDALRREGFERCCANISKRNRVSADFFAACDFACAISGSSAA